MPDRSILHRLVDSLPESALERVQHILEYQQQNPREVRTDLNTLHKRMQEHIRRQLQPHVGGMITVGSMSPDGTGCMSVQGFEENGVHLTLSFRHFRRHKLEIVERTSLSPDGRLLQYQQGITGPDGKKSQHEAEFSVA